MTSPWQSIATILLTLLLISILVFVHELGHFLAARAVGVKVTKFVLGFGPRLWAKQVGATEYSIRLFPLGGFVQMHGDADATSFKPDTEVSADPESYLSKKPWQKLLITTAGVFVNLLFGIFVFSIYLPLVGNNVILPQIGNFQAPFGENYNFVLSYAPANNLAQSEGFIVGFERGNETNWLPKTSEELYSFLGDTSGQKVKFRIFDGKDYFEREEVLDGEGIASNLDADLRSELVADAQESPVRIAIGNVQSDSPFARGLTQASIQPEAVSQSVISKLAGKSLFTYSQLQTTLNENLGKEVQVELLTAKAEKLSLTVTLPATRPTEGGLLGVADLQLISLGFNNDLSLVRYPTLILGGVQHSFNIVLYQAYALPYLVKEAFQGRPEQLSNNVGSVVLVGDEIGNILSLSATAGIGFLVYILNLLGAFSLALAFMNILPIPLFDGGHVMFILYEWLRGKPLPPMALEWIYRIFFVLLIVLGVVVIGKDLLKLIQR